MKNIIQTIALIVLCALLFVIVAIDENEIRNLKAELDGANGTIAEIQKQNDDLTEELAAQIRRAEAAEEELDSYNAQTYYAPQSYYDSDYDDMTDQEYIAWRESGWNYDARNGRYIGKYQMDESRLDGDWSPEHQEEVAEQYMLDRYGSWEAAREFWDANGWW